MKKTKTNSISATIKKLQKETTHITDDEGAPCAVKHLDRIKVKRHFTIEAIFEKVMQAQKELKNLKKELFTEVKAYLADTASEYGENWKGNAKLYNFDNTKEVEMSIHRQIDFDERLQIAKTKIDECLKRWSGGATDELKSIVMIAFKVDKKGKVDVRQILKLKQFQFEDVVWKEAIDIIDQSLMVIGSKEYLTFSMRDNPRADFKPITLNFSSIDMP